jgi:hypothetical protein
MNDTVTHFVHQGKRESTKDFLKAKEMGCVLLLRFFFFLIRSHTQQCGLCVPAVARGVCCEGPALGRACLPLQHRHEDGIARDQRAQEQVRYQTIADG